MNEDKIVDEEWEKEKKKQKDSPLRIYYFWKQMKTNSPCDRGWWEWDGKSKFLSFHFLFFYFLFFLMYLKMVFIFCFVMLLNATSFRSCCFENTYRFSSIISFVLTVSERVCAILVCVHSIYVQHWKFVQFL